MRSVSLVKSQPRVGSFDDLARSLRPWLWLRVMFNSRRLDRELAEGLSPGTTEERLFRASQLTDPDQCAGLASSLRDVVAKAAEPAPAAVSSALPIRREVVNAWGEELLDIADRLDRADRADISAVARVRALLSDGTGPLFNREAERSMGEVIALIEKGFAGQIATGVR